MAPSYFGSRGVLALTKDIALSGGYHAVIGRLTVAQQDECLAVLNGGATPTVRTVAKARGGSSTADVERVTEMPENFRRHQTAVVTRSIRSWDLTEEDGTVATIDEAHVQLLLDADRNKIFLAINEWDKPLSGDELGE